jgi:hypothetical protein
LFDAAGGVVFRVEVKNDRLSFEVAEFDGFSPAIRTPDGGGGEGGGFVAGLKKHEKDEG